MGTQKDNNQTTAQGVKSTQGLDFSCNIQKGKWILWRWKKEGGIYREAYIQEKRDKMLALNNSWIWTAYPNWVDMDEIEISWIGDKQD